MSTKIPSSFKARSPDDLARILDDWGCSAPSRLERTGRQKELERWVLNRFLEAMMTNNELTYPITVFESEAPDFRLDFCDQKIGIEVTEAVDENEQREWTKLKKLGKTEDRYRTKDFQFGDHENQVKYRQLIASAIKRKSDYGYPIGTWLLIYVNTHLSEFEDIDWHLEAFDQLDLGEYFSRIWVLDQHLYSLHEHRVLARALS